MKLARTRLRELKEGGWKRGATGRRKVVVAIRVRVRARVSVRISVRVKVRVRLRPGVIRVLASILLPVAYGIVSSD